MGDYYCSRLWQLKQGASPQEVEHLASSGVLEMLRWIPGVKQASLIHLANGEPRRYLLNLTFTSQASYTYWRQVEEEAPDYWERFASVQMHWEQLCSLVEEYAGEMLMDVGLEQDHT
ncbi:MAG: hypothetical protein NVS4B11_25860 [Ktedonobacteraceae bacterium]